MREERKQRGGQAAQGNLYLIGFMGTGKSTVAAALERRGFERIEMDDAIEEQAGRSILEVFSRFGEEHFRNLETAFLKELQGKDSAVVSCGGGAAMRRENVELMKKSGSIVLLQALAETVYERVKDSGNRPLLKGRMNVESIRELMETRRPYYEAAADLAIQTDGKSADEIAREILEGLS